MKLLSLFVFVFGALVAPIVADDIANKNSPQTIAVVVLGVVRDPGTRELAGANTTALDALRACKGLASIMGSRLYVSRKKQDGSFEVLVFILEHQGKGKAGEEELGRIRLQDGDRLDFHEIVC